MPESATDTSQDLTPLQMARNAAAAVNRYAIGQQVDPLSSHINGWGQQGASSAQIAGNMALVAIAEDLHAIRALLATMVSTVMDEERAANFPGENPESNPAP